MNKRTRHRGACFVALLASTLVFGVLGSPFPLLAGQLRASVAKIDITPDQSEWLLGYAPRQSRGVHDHLYHRIVAMDDGDTQFFLISTDICMFSPSVYDNLMTELQAQMGIRPLQVWWTTTHTHSAPEVGPPGLPGVFMGKRYEHDHNTEYSSWVEQKLIEGIKEARANLRPARLGVGWGLAIGQHQPSSAK